MSSPIWDVNALLINILLVNQCSLPGSIKDIQWSDVQVGNLLMVKDDELLPADILCLYSDLPERVCYIKTTNLVRACVY